MHGVKHGAFYQDYYVDLNLDQWGTRLLVNEDLSHHTWYQAIVCDRENQILYMNVTVIKIISYNIYY